MRLHLIGGPGSGKTFLSRILGEENRVPVLGLDDIFWDRSAGQYGIKPDEAVRDAALRDFVAQDRWIVEGVYYRWAMASFERADHIIVLTTPLWLRQVRIFKRFLRRKVGLEPSKNETWKSFREMAVWNRAYDGDNLARAIVMLEEAKLPVQKCAGLADIRRLIGRIEGGR
jgi:adenylate kinase family enzyme